MRTATTKIAELGAQLFAGIAYLHSRSIIHCDIKPDNIGLACTWRTKLLDFGFAQDQSVVPMPVDMWHTLLYSALEDPELFRWIRQLFEQLRLPDYSIVFQMSESSVITHLKQARAMAAALHKINCKISLFDFGVEPNPFQLIKHVPADYVKINREFMRNLTTSMENQQAIQSISEKARRHGQVSIAPDVEDAGTLSVLWGLGTDLIQGDFLQAQAEELGYDFSAMTA